MSQYLRKLTVRNLGPIQTATLHLTQIHALIGPNDTGKSTLLGAVRNAGGFIHAEGMIGKPSRDGTGQYYGLEASDGAAWEFGQGRNSASSGTLNPPKGAKCSPAVAFGAALSRIEMLRLDPDEIRLPTRLLIEDQPLAFENDRGRGLGAVLDALFAREPETFLQLQDELRQLFDTVAGFRLFTGNDGRQVGVRLKNGAEIHPSQMSEGMLYFLAFSVMRYLGPISILLVEEPENGLHPSRIADVMRVLRKVSETTQVIIATHSPLVVNELEPDEVTIVTRSAERGTICTPIRETKDFEQRSKVYALGELWLSYANGVDEAPLLNGKT